MSTYTDLHNRIKENIAVDYNNRITPQRVRFFNEQNEYWGTFKGHVSAENINITGGTLSGVTLIDAILGGSLALPDGVDLYNILQQVSQISAGLIDVNGNLTTEIENLTTLINIEKHARISSVNNERDNRISAIQTEASARQLVDQELSIAIGNANNNITSNFLILSGHLTNKIANVSSFLDQQDQDISTFLNTQINTETDNRILNDNLLSDEIFDVKADLFEEISNRILADNKLDNDLNNIENESILRDTELSNALSLHNEQNINSFAQLDTKMLSTVEKEKHYDINYENTTMDYPYVANDYSVNVFKAKVPDARVIYEDDAGLSVEVGTIILSDPTVSQPLPFVFKPYLNIDNNAIASVLVGGREYQFNQSSPGAFESKAGYNINYVIDPLNSSELSDVQLKLVPEIKTFHKVYLGGTSGQMIGKFSSVSHDGSTNELTSGILHIDSNDSELQTFNKFRDIYFDTLENTESEKGTEKITYLGGNEFVLQKNIDVKKYIQLLNTLDNNKAFGRIYDLLNGVSGIVSNDIEGITDINVTLDQPDTIGYLNIENNFTDIVKTTNTYEYVLSANVDQTSATIDVVEKSELYKYDFTSINGGAAIGTITPDVYNKYLVHDPEYNKVSVDISNIPGIGSFARVHELTKVPNEGNLWTYEETNNGNILNLRFNNIALRVRITSVDSGDPIIKQYYSIDINNPQIANLDTCHNLLYSTGLIDLEQQRSTFPRPEATYSAFIDSSEQQDIQKTYDLNIDTINSDTVKIVFPDKNEETPDISREFFITIKLDSLVQKTVRAEFIHTNGQPVKFYNNKNKYLDIIAGSNKEDWVTYMVNEVRKNRFLITDLNDYEQNEIINQLRTDLNTEINDRILSITNLSTSLSNEIDNLSTSLSTEIDNLSISLSTTAELSINNLQDQIISNDNDIEEIYSRIKGGINYKGVIYCETSATNGALVQIPTVSELFYNIHTSGVIDGYTEDTVLSNGFMYIVQKFNSSDNYKFTVEGIDIEVNDYVIINCKDSNSKIIKDLTYEDINVIDAEDHDVVYQEELNNVSSFLNNEININKDDIIYLSTEISSNDDDINFLSVEYNRLSNELSTEIDNLSTSLSTEIDNLSTSLSNEIIDLSTSLSTEIDNLSTSLSTTAELSINNLQDQIISNDNDIDLLNNDVDYLLEVDKKTVVYNETLLSIDTSFNQTLTGFMLANFANNSNYNFEHGQMYRLSVGQELIDDTNNINKYIGSNDYIIFNKNVTLSNITFNDIDIIHDTFDELLSVQTDVNNDIDNLDSKISTKIWIKDPSVPKLQNGVYSDLSVQKVNVAEYKNLLENNQLDPTTLYVVSADYVESYGRVISNMIMTDDITPSEAASQHYVDTIKQNTNLSIENLDSIVTTNTNDISELDNQMLSINTRYSNTFTNVDKSVGHLLTDNLVLTDTSTINGNIRPQYYLTFENGTIVLKPIN